MQLQRSLAFHRRGLTMGWVAAIPAVLGLLLLGAGDSARAGTLDRVRDLGKLKLGYRVDARPFSYEDESRKPAGYSLVLCRRVANAVKAEPGFAQIAVEYVKVGSEDRFDAVKEGKIDLLCGAATATLERRKTVDFSTPIFPSGIGALLRRDAPERLKAALEGREPPYRPLWRASLAEVLEKRVLSAQAGTTTESWLARRREELNVNAVIGTVQSYREGVDRVLGRRSDVLFGDRSSAHDLVVLTRQFTYEPLALASARGDDDFRLLVDRTLSRLYRSGEIAGIYTSFFGEPDANALAFFGFVALPE